MGISKTPCGNGDRRNPYDIPYSKERQDCNYLEKLPRKHRGAKTFLPDNINERVIAVIKNMRAAGCVVNYKIAISIVKGIVLANDRPLLKENFVLEVQAQMEKGIQPPKVLEQLDNTRPLLYLI